MTASDDWLTSRSLVTSREATPSSRQFVPATWGQTTISRSSRVEWFTRPLSVYRTSTSSDVPPPTTMLSAPFNKPARGAIVST